MSYHYTTTTTDNNNNNYNNYHANNNGPIIVVQGTPVVEPMHPVNRYANNTGYEPGLTPMTSSGIGMGAFNISSSNKANENDMEGTPYVTSDRSHSGINNTERKFQDVPFAILFVAHLLLMGYLCAVNSHKLYDDYYMEQQQGGNNNRVLHVLQDIASSRILDSDNGSSSDDAYVTDTEQQGQDHEYWHSGMFQAEQDGEGDDDITGAMYGALFMSFLLASVFSGLSLSFMLRHSEGLIKTALIFNCVVYGVFGLLMLMTGVVVAALISLILFAICACYAKAVWERIPFAAVNMKTAISAVRANIGVTIYAYIALFFFVGWTVWWSVTAITTLNLYDQDDQDDKDDPDASEVNGGLLFLFLISYYWTHQVISNVVHVTVSGVVGTWWFAPADAGSCCSPATRDSFFRATTYSFGSICLGSLIVAILEATREMVRSARNSEDGILVCLADCCLGILESLVEYFNKWAFVFVGLYGFTFVEAGKNVINLFKSRGWDTIITDNLCDRVLLLVSLGVGVLTGSFLDLFMIMTFGIAGDSSALILFFVVGFLIGLMWSYVLFGTISSAIATVIVCYAESPADFDRNHPALSSEMRSKWRQAWPTDFKY